MSSSVILNTATAPERSSVLGFTPRSEEPALPAGRSQAIMYGILRRYLRMTIGLLLALSPILYAAPPVHAADSPFSVIGAVKPGETCKDDECRKTICPCVARDFTTGECAANKQMMCFSGKCGVNAQEASNSKLPCNYTLDDIVLTGVKIAQFIFGITGSLMLLFFVYGGFKMLTAGGNAEHIQAAQKVLTAAVIGGMIILGAALLVRFVVKDVLQISITGGPNVGTITVPQ